MPKRGRPVKRNKYAPVPYSKRVEIVIDGLIRKYCLDNGYVNSFNVSNLAENLQISRDTFYLWWNRRDELYTSNIHQLLSGAIFKFLHYFF
jgi:hypothetical protein